MSSNPARWEIEWAEATDDVDRPRLFVMSVGVDQYFDSRLRLAHARRDAITLASALERSGSEIFSDVVVEVLLDEQVNARLIGATFARFARVMSANDLFVLFVAGHGLTEEGRDYFIPHDFVYTDAGQLSIGLLVQPKGGSRIR